MQQEGVDLGFFSHMPVLAAAVAMSDGPVIEFGTGWGSTPMLHMMCGMRGRFLVSMDTDEAWARTFGDGYFCPRRHEFKVLAPATLGVVKRVELVEEYARSMAQACQWGVVFVDCAPGEARGRVVMAFKGRAKWIVAHDYDESPTNTNGYGPLKDAFKHRSVMKRMRPWTVVWSDEEKFPIEAVDA